MTAHFLGTGYLFIWALVGLDPGPKRPPYPYRLLILLMTLAFHAFFGIALMSGATLLAPSWWAALGQTDTAALLADQQRGGGDRLGRGRPALAAARGGAARRLDPQRPADQQAARPPGRPGRRRGAQGLQRPAGRADAARRARAVSRAPGPAVRVPSGRRGWRCSAAVRCCWRPPRTSRAAGRCRGRACSPSRAFALGLVAVLLTRRRVRLPVLLAALVPQQVLLHVLFDTAAAARGRLQPGAGRAPRDGGAHLHARARHGPDGLRLADVRRPRRRDPRAPPGCSPRARPGAGASSPGSRAPRTSPRPPVRADAVPAPSPPPSSARCSSGRTGPAPLARDPPASSFASPAHPPHPTRLDRSPSRRAALPAPGAMPACSVEGPHRAPSVLRPKEPHDPIQRPSGAPARPTTLAALGAGLVLALVAAPAYAHDRADVEQPRRRGHAGHAARPGRPDLRGGPGRARRPGRRHRPRRRRLRRARRASTALDVVQDVQPSAPAGRYTVEWRLTSDDGHPVSGTLGFTATAAAAGGGRRRAAASASATPAPAEAPRREPLIPSWGWIAAGVIAIVAAIRLNRRASAAEQAAGGLRWPSVPTPPPKTGGARPAPPSRRRWRGRSAAAP